MKKRGQILILLTPLISLLLLVFFRESIKILGNIPDTSFFYFLKSFFNYVRPYYTYLYLTLLLLLYIFTAVQFTRNSKTEKWWNYSILPSCFTLSLVSFVVLIPNVFFVRFLFILNFIFIYLYFRSIYGIINSSEKDDRYALENLSSYGNFLAVYFLGASVYGLQSFLSVPLFYLMMILAVFITLVAYQVLWANKISNKESVVFLFVISIAIMELAWSISYLTLSYYVLGLVLAIFYYVMIGIVRFHLRGNLDSKIIKMYIIFGSLSMLTVLLSATWL